MASRTSRSVVVLSLVVLLSVVGHADVFFGVSEGANACTGCPTASNAIAFTPGLISYTQNPLNQTYSDAYSQLTGLAQGTVSMGYITGYAGAGSTVNDPYFPSGIDMGIGTGSNFEGVWQDVITVMGQPGQQIGDPADLQLTLMLHALIGPSNLGAGCFFTNPIAYANGEAMFNGMSLSADSCSSPTSQVVQEILQVSVGARIALTGSLSIAAAAKGLNQEGESKASFDANSTTLSFVDSLTPGVFVVSDSGHDYSSPQSPTAVPEPSSLFLLSTGVSALAGVIRRKRPNSSPGLRRG